jgi:ABC-type multidrug transport system ATPase subunit
VRGDFEALINRAKPVDPCEIASSASRNCARSISVTSSSTIAHLDRILVFDRGRIIEDGTHTNLLSLGGAYYRLWQMQAGGFLPEQDNHNDWVAAKNSGKNSL